MGPRSENGEVQDRRWRICHNQKKLNPLQTKPRVKRVLFFLQIVLLTTPVLAPKLMGMQRKGTNQN
jgi:hypothetical protein